MGFWAYTNVFSIIRCQSKWGLKIIQSQIHSFLGIRNELPWRMRTIRALIQNIREKNRIYREIPNLFSGNKSYKRFQMTKITGSIFSMTYKKIENISRTSIALLNGVNCKVSTTTHEDLHYALRPHYCSPSCLLCYFCHALTRYTNLFHLPSLFF